ncbi:Fe2+-dependent dioxygenase [Solemya pervernicosa gill symbiont]|uniref:Fe2+-dependent dioxygenase n=2 Tax=Gammaproteobacteria incertae sedis TaxID=118884 RepID=A0A1T2L6S3_9GAMM|nr:Fe2+-dependent dioxygenase [Candidatus Reidiella endopervernicosa]OOZ40808.1 Fe2+-dependent dioxygenase [Solemya pervernicosa gill symbiont]QKQ26320.1 Fe2+-dependent dioxygenase [Candidatus Reidiella endopervernicosa]
MLLHIPKVLESEELQAVVNVLNQSQFVDGKLTAGQAAERVKSNLELGRDQPQRDPLAKIIIGALHRSEIFNQAALPYKIATPLFARYTAGMSYGSHVDDPIMGAPGPLYRTDVSFTVFLTEPDAYEGGELTVRTNWGEQQVKFAAGDAVIYPSGTLHRVAEVTGGERMVAVGWAQSVVRDPAQREILYELGQARNSLLKSSPQSEECDWVDHSYINLVRMWGEV